MSNYKVCVFDFSKIDSDGIKRLLRKYGHEVIQENIEDKCVESAIKEMPHVILINSVEENHTGLEICKKLKENDITKDIPIVIAFNLANTKLKKEYILAGTDDYINYPLEKEELILKINNLAKSRLLKTKLNKYEMALQENNELINRQKNELYRNLSVASKIQEALIPKFLGDIPNCSFSWIYQPSGKVGGDIFDIFMLDDEHLGIYMIDVMGHGVASSMLAVILSETLTLNVDKGSPLKRKTNSPPYYEIVSPIEVIHYLNERFPFGKYEHYFTIFYAILNIKTGAMKYVRAGHPNPIRVRDTGDIMELDAYGTPVGFEFAEKYIEETVYLDSGDHLIIYTDGLMELEDGSGKPIETEGIINYIKEESNSVNKYLTRGLNKLIRQQTTLKDDLSVLELRWIKFV